MMLVHYQFGLTSDQDKREYTRLGLVACAGALIGRRAMTLDIWA